MRSRRRRTSLGAAAAYDLRTPLFWEMSSILVIILVVPVLFVAVRRINHVSAMANPACLRGSRDCRVLEPAHRRHGRTSQTRDVPGRRFLRFSPLGCDRALRIPQGRRHLPVDRQHAVADRQPPRRAPRRPPHAAAAAADPATAPHWSGSATAQHGSVSNPRDILWISSAGNYVEYSLADGITHLVRGTLAGEKARLTKFNIVRVHRTRLVNLSRVTGLKAGAERRLRTDARYRSGRYGQPTIPRRA